MPLGQLVGDTAKLANFRKGLQKLGEGGFQQVVVLVAARGSGLIRRGFDTSTAPDGAPWAPTVAGNKPLIRSHALETAASQMRPSANGVRVRISLSYAGYHLTGTKNKDGTERMPARPYLPSSEYSALPPAWVSMIEGAVRSTLSIFLPS